jgi:hypothetical protein
MAKRKAPAYYTSDHTTLYQAMVSLIKKGGFSESDADIIISMAAKEDPDSSINQFIKAAKNYRIADCDRITLTGIDGALYRAAIVYKASTVESESVEFQIKPIY